MAAAEPAKRRPSAGRGTARRPAGDKAAPSRPGGPARAIRSAVEQLGLLLGRAPESVSAIWGARCRPRLARPCMERRAAGCLAMVSPTRRRCRAGSTSSLR